MSDLDGQIPQFLSSLGLPMQASVKSFIYRNTSPSEIRYNGVEILSEKKRLSIRLNLHVSNPNNFSNLNSNCSNLLDMRNLQEQAKKAFCYQQSF